MEEPSYITRLQELGYSFQGSDLTSLEEELRNVLDDNPPEEVRQLIEEWLLYL